MFPIPSPGGSTRADDTLTGATSVTGALQGWTILGSTSTTSWSCATVSGTLLCKGDGVFGTIPSTTCPDNVSCTGWFCSNNKPGTHKCVPSWTAMPDVPPMKQVLGSCALSVGGEVHCWNMPRRDPSPVPTPIARLALPPVRKLAGNFAILDNGDLRELSGRATGLTDVVEACGGLRLGIETACALTTAGVVHCWGHNEFGAVGDGTTIDRASPVEIGSGFTGLACGGFTSCGLRADGNVECWGNVGSATNALTPTHVTGLDRVVQLAHAYIGSFFALREDGHVVLVSLGAKTPIQIVH